MAAVMYYTRPGAWVSRGKRGDLPAKGGLPGPPGPRVLPRTKEKARASGVLGNVSFGEGVSARGGGLGTGKRRLAGPSGVSGPPGLPGPGVRLGNGEATACGAFPGFRAARPGGMAENKGKGPRDGPGGGRFVWRRCFGLGAAGEREATACGACPGFPALGCCREQRKRPAGAGLAEGALPGGGGIRARRPAGPSGFGIRG